MSSTKAADSTLLYKRFMMQEAIKDVGAAVNQGVLSNSAACDVSAVQDSTRLTGNAKTPSTGAGATSSNGLKALDHLCYISASERLRKLTDGAKQVKSMFQEFATLSNKSTTIGGDTAVAARALASREIFVRECGLEDDPLDASSASRSTPVVAESSQKRFSNATENVEVQLQPLLKILENVRNLRKLPRFNYQKSLREAAEGGSASSTAAQHIHMLVKRLEETLADTVNTIRAHASIKPVGSHVIKDICAWPVDLLRMLNDTMNMKTLEVLTEAGREQLRRIAFDVEELQHEQQQAVTDGDMQKSEQLYFEQTNVLETMKPQFDQLEAVMEKYRKERGDAVRDSLKMYHKTFRQQMTNAVRREERGKKQTDGDSQKLIEKRSEVEKARKDQKANFDLYHSEWEKLFDVNVEQQAACFRAMEELERRVQQLSAEQAILIADRIEKINVERDRALDAAAFYYFCDSRTKSSKDAGQTAQTAVNSLKEVGSAIEFSVTQFDNFLKECVVDHTEEELLKLRKQKLDQFRQLYLTLGDLQFKKSRHAEEIDKKIEYYSLQQEIAMDTLNPKAKEYSQAKKKWQAVQNELQEQLHALEEKSDAEADAFRPTEQLLIKAGVSFKNPVDELREKNEVRQQKLLEYKEMMDAKVAEQHKKQMDANGKVSVPIRDDDEVMLAEKAREQRGSGSSRSVLQSSEGFGKPPASTPATKTTPAARNTSAGARKR